MSDHIYSRSLGALDDIMPDIDLPFILAFPCRTQAQSETTRRLSVSFNTLLSANPWMCGIIRSNLFTPEHRPGTKFLCSSLNPADKDSRKLTTIQTSEFTHPQLSIQDVSHHPLYENKDYNSLVAENMPSRYLDAKILMPTRDTGEPFTNYLLQAKVSYIQNGVFLCLCTSHAIMDATGLSTIAEAWAALARGDVVGNVRHWPLSEKEMGLEGDSHSKKEAYGHLKGRNELWHMLGLDYRSKESTSAMLAKAIPHRETETKIFRLSAENLLLLKKECRTALASTDIVGKKTHEKGGKWLSTNDAISSLLWRCIVRARLRTVDDMAKTSTMMYAMNIRRDLQNMQANYGEAMRERVANVVVYSVNKARTRELVAVQSIGETANDIRAAISLHKEPATLRDVLRLAASIPDVSSLGLVYPTWLAEDVVISSLFGLTLYKTHWGSVFEGSHTVPDHVRFPQGVFEGITFIMPQRQTGDVEVVVTMIMEDMKALLRDGEWQKHMEVMSQM